MTTPQNGPDGTRSIRAKVDTHQRLTELAETLGGSMDDALTHLLDPSTVRIRLSTQQRRRWSHEADEIGVSLEQFVMMRVEAALQYGLDPAGLHALYTHMRTIVSRIHGGGDTPPPATPRPTD